MTAQTRQTCKDPMTIVTKNQTVKRLPVLKHNVSQECSLHYHLFWSKNLNMEKKRLTHCWTSPKISWVTSLVILGVCLNEDASCSNRC